MRLKRPGLVRLQCQSVFLSHKHRRLYFEGRRRVRSSSGIANRDLEDEAASAALSFIRSLSFSLTNAALDTLVGRGSHQERKIRLFEERNTDPISEFFPDEEAQNSERSLEPKWRRHDQYLLQTGRVGALSKTQTIRIYI